MDALCDRPKVVAIGGPTATGKTALSVALAQKFHGEVINADSMQIYRGLSIGTAKPPPEERQGVPHHLLDFLPPEQPYSVADYVAAAARQIEQITARGNLPLLTGGTGLYITSLLRGVKFGAVQADPDLRSRLQREAQTLGAQALHERLRAVDPAYSDQVHPNNVTRVVRALELYELTGQTKEAQQQASCPETPPYRALCLCLTCRDRSLLYQRIDRRVDQMLADGLLEEAELVWRNRERYCTAAQAIGYKEFFPYFEQAQTLAECAARLKQATRRYAKRQLTWFRHQSDAVWLYVEDADLLERACGLIRNFLEE